MSGGSYEETCPECGNDMDCYTDWKPYNMDSGECLNCGFHYWTEEGQMTLEEVNEKREERELEPLTALGRKYNDENGSEPDPVGQSPKPGA